MATIDDLLRSKRTEGVRSVGYDASVHQAVSTMCIAHIGAVMVKQGDAYVGILSERDVMVRVVMQKLDPATTPVATVMTRSVVCIGRSALPEQAMAIMTERRCRHLPVMEGERVVAMLSIGDLVRWASQNHEVQIRTLEEYIAGKYPG